MVKGKYIKSGKFCVKRIENPKKFAKDSFRTIKVSKNVRVTIGCPKGKWNKRSKRCKVGTRAQRVMVKPKKGKCPRGKHVKR